jgi:hypothetical protein
VENIPQIIYAIVNLHLTSSIPGSLPPATLYHLGRFTEYAEFVTLKQLNNSDSEHFTKYMHLLRCNKMETRSNISSARVK